MALSAYILAQCEPNSTKQIIQKIAKHPNIDGKPNLKGFATFGRYDLVITCNVDTPEELTQLLLDYIHPLKGIQRTETLICQYSSSDVPQE